uniref:Uncharacterized protein n=1 Tax=Quercus lobata TaxID=97700 RepID=A0A7N2R8I4_QUELO
MGEEPADDQTPFFHTQPVEHPLQRTDYMDILHQHHQSSTISSSTSSHALGSPWMQFCHFGKRAPVKTSWTGKSIGRRKIPEVGANKHNGWEIYHKTNNGDNDGGLCAVMDADELYITDFNSEKEKSQQSLLMSATSAVLCIVVFYLICYLAVLADPEI